jgi:heptosyltransferase III
VPIIQGLGSRSQEESAPRRELCPNLKETDQNDNCDTFFSMDTAQILPNLPAAAKILFVRLRSLGDTILSTPLLSALKSWRPDLQISVLVEAPNHEVLTANSDIHEILTIRPRKNWTPFTILERGHILHEIRKRQYDCCINLHGGSTSAWFTGLSASRFRVGLQSFCNSRLYNVRIAVPRVPDRGQKQHTVEFQMEWLYALGMAKGVIPPLRVAPDPLLEAQSSALLRNAGIDENQPYCVVQPTSRFHTKEWTAWGFAKISDYLAENWGLQVVLTGGPGEEQKLQKVAALCQRNTACLSRPSITELIWVISKARLFVGNDSGPTHLAAALQIPAVVLFGSSDSQVWYPWKARHRIVQNPYTCNPCPGYRCLVYDEPHCILSLTTHQVRKAIEGILSEDTAGRGG